MIYFLHKRHIFCWLYFHNIPQDLWASLASKCCRNELFVLKGDRRISWSCIRRIYKEKRRNLFAVQKERIKKKRCAGVGDRKEGNGKGKLHSARWCKCAIVLTVWLFRFRGGCSYRKFYWINACKRVTYVSECVFRSTLRLGYFAVPDCITNVNELK